MKQKKTNQERARKYGGSSSFVDAGQPSRAPRQDEDGKESVGSTDAARASVDEGPQQVGGNRGRV
jgi:hypothetical protein